MFRAMRARPAPPERPGPSGSTTLRRVSGRPGRKVLASRSGRRRRVAHRTAGRARPGRRRAAWGRRRGPDTRSAHNRSRGPPRVGGRLARAAGRPTSPCHPPDEWGRVRRSRPANPQPRAKPPRPARALRPAKPRRPARALRPAKPPRPARPRPAKPRRPARPRPAKPRRPARPRHGSLRRRARPRHGQVRRRGPGTARFRRAILGGPTLRRRPSKPVTLPAARTPDPSPRPRGAELVGCPPGPATAHPPGGGRRPLALRDHALPGQAPRERALPGQAPQDQAPRARPDPAASLAGTRRSSGRQSTRVRPLTGSGRAQVNRPVRRVSSRPPTMTSTSTGT
jgi:hypothetical protein